VKAGILVVIILSVVALILSGSRGAWVAALAMTVFASLRSKRALAWMLAGGLIFAACIPYLPDSIVDRFLTIQHYDTDASFQGRVGSWQYALDKFPERPIVGGGFLIFDDEYKTSSHNSFVQALGEHGAVGLLLYVGLLIAAAATSITIRKRTAGRSELKWASHLAFMIQVSLLGYAVGSLTITAAFFPIFYAILGVLNSLQVLVKRELESTKLETDNLPQKPLRWRAA
jgi:probable O-glycosylation ligase (exosortase A-associated)